MKAIIFDMDGLMIDSERLYIQSEREIARRFHKQVREETIWNMMGRKPIESMRILKEDLNIAVEAEELLRMRDEMMREKLKNDLIPMQGLTLIVDTFYAKLKMAISTGAPREFLNIVLQRLHLESKFDILQDSDDITHGKPNPEIYLTTCDKLRLKPVECVVLEDSSNGAMAGKRAGCYVIAVPSEYTRKQDFGFVDFCARDLFHATDHIKTLVSDILSEGEFTNDSFQW